MEEGGRCAGGIPTDGVTTAPMSVGGLDAVGAPAPKWLAPNDAQGPIARRPATASPGPGNRDHSAISETDDCSRVGRVVALWRSASRGRRSGSGGAPMSVAAPMSHTADDGRGHGSKRITPGHRAEVRWQQGSYESPISSPRTSPSPANRPSHGFAPSEWREVAMGRDARRYSLDARTRAARRRFIPTVARGRRPGLGRSTRSRHFMVGAAVQVGPPKA